MTLFFAWPDMHWLVSVIMLFNDLLLDFFCFLFYKINWLFSALFSTYAENSYLSKQKKEGRSKTTRKSVSPNGPRENNMGTLKLIEDI